MPTKRPDGGWGWVIAGATFLTNFMQDGVKYSFGIMFMELLDAFHESKSATSWIVSIQVAMLCIISPVAGALINRFGCRAVAILGTLIAFAGFLASPFATSVYYLYISFGVVGGIGFGTATLPMLVTVAQYFDRHLALASGISATGSGIGMLLFGPLSKILIDEYTWRGTLLIEAAILLNGLLCAAVLRPVPQGPPSITVPEQAKKACMEQEADGTVIEQHTYRAVSEDTKARLFQDDDSGCVNSEETSTHVISEFVNKLPLTEPESERTVINGENERNITESESKHTDASLSPETESAVDDDETKQVLNETYSKDLTQTTQQHKDSEQDTEVVLSETRLSQQRQGTIEPVKSRETLQTPRQLSDSADNAELCEKALLHADTETEFSNTMKPATKGEKHRWLSLAPLKDVRYLLLICATMLVELSLMTPYTFLPVMMIQAGYEKKDAVFMLFLIGLLSTIARITSGFVGDLRFVDRVKLCYFVIIVSGVLVALAPLCFNYASYVAFAVLFGFVSGSSAALRAVLLPDLFGVEMIADRMGILNFFNGGAALVGLPVTGAIYDVSGSYVIPFLVAGIEMVVSGGLVCIIAFTRKPKPKQT